MSRDAFIAAKAAAEMLHGAASKATSAWGLTFTSFKTAYASGGAIMMQITSASPKDPMDSQWCAPRHGAATIVVAAHDMHTGFQYGSGAAPSFQHALRKTIIIIN